MKTPAKPKATTSSIAKDTLTTTAKPKRVSKAAVKPAALIKLYKTILFFLVSKPMLLRRQEIGMTQLATPCVIMLLSVG